VGESLADSGVEAEVALASIDTHHADRDAHVRSADSSTSTGSRP
jgi:polyisoprenoid-binding protein YceI